MILFVFGMHEYRYTLCDCANMDCIKEGEKGLIAAPRLHTRCLHVNRIMLQWWSTYTRRSWYYLCSVCTWISVYTIWLCKHGLHQRRGQGAYCRPEVAHKMHTCRLNRVTMMIYISLVNSWKSLETMEGKRGHLGVILEPSWGHPSWFHLGPILVASRSFRDFKMV